MYVRCEVVIIMLQVFSLVYNFPAPAERCCFSPEV